jgi:DNA topoisomerase-1
MLKQGLVTDIQPLELQQHPDLAAKAAGLRYVSDIMPGFTRRKRGSSFVYLDTQGKILKDQKQLQRIRTLVIPPAWTSVWICPLENGHLQATGRDEKGRKQYRYHEDWNQIRNETKFTKMHVFAEKLPEIRKRVQKDLETSGIGRNKVLAAIVKIMEQTMIRIGNEEYAEKNESYGLTTIRNKHAEVHGPKVRFRFKGKSGKLHDVEIEDRRIAQIVRKCQELQGQELFGYIDEDGNAVDVSSNDVNEYLREITGENITAKDFRTWGGTVQAALAFQELGPHKTKTELKKMMVQAVQRTAACLRNTPSVCRKYYIHPCVFKAYESGSLFKIHASCQKSKRSKIKGLFAEEIFALRLLEKAST